jgi:dihydrodipicolinate reductase
LLNQSDARIKVAVAGINGRMGRASLTPILKDGAFELVGAFGRRSAICWCDLSEFTDATESRQLGVPVAHLLIICLNLLIPMPLSFLWC